MLKEIVKKFTPSFLVLSYHFLLASFGAVIYGFPSRKLKVVGVTGTKGKSTTVELASAILEEAGFKTALISSIRFKVGKKERKNMLKMTMPGRFKIQKFLKEAVKENCDYVLLEVTSEGILQHRHRFVDFEAVVFTNLSPEHIERHGSFENYRREKGKLFKACKKTHIINLDDKNAEYFLRFPAEKKINFSISEAKNIQEFPGGTSFEFRGVKFNLNLVGRFNVHNSLAAISVGLSEGISLEICKKALEKVKRIPGRMEVVINEPFKVIVDYAHTPQSLEQVYQTLRNSKQILDSDAQNSKLICVLGSCGGGRDKWKRPELGKIAAIYCDEIILTNEDPYDENPSQILSEIKSGITKKQETMTNLYEILDRREAINRALCLAKPSTSPETVVVITGKGCEPWMCVEEGKRIPWDDRKVVKEELQKLESKPNKSRRSSRFVRAFEILPHTADKKIRVFGRTKEGLFENALLGTAEVMEPEVGREKPEIKRKIKVNSVDLTSLLVDFLSEVLYLSQVHKEIYRDIEILKFKDTELEGEIVGRKVGRFNEDIKGVTYHGLKVQQKDGLWRADILFDV